MTTTDYGCWPSPITTDHITDRSVTLMQLRVDGARTLWVERRPQQDGRHVLLCRSALGVTEEVLPLIDGSSLADVRTRVHEYGGRAYAAEDGLIVFSHGGDNRVYAYNLNDRIRGPVPLTPYDARRYGDFEIATVRGLVYAVCEDHRGDGEPINTLVSIPLDGSAARNADAIVTISEGTDFVTSPSLSPDGTKLAWLTWDHPDMPWTHSRLVVAGLDFEGKVTSQLTLVDEKNVCVYEPRWTLDGDLIHVDDSSDWANLHRTSGFTWEEDEEPDAWMGRLRTRRLHPGPKAFSHPHWQLGLHSFDNLDHEHLVCSWSEEGRWHIGTVRLDNGELEEWDIPWWPVGNVAASEGRVVMLADSALRPATIVEIKDARVSELRSSTYAELPAEWVAKAEFLTWPTADGEQCHGLFYPPTNPEHEGPQSALPPLIVMVHGGPTSATRPGLSLPIQFWTSRGFAVLDVNYRGSTGYGRHYREALNGHWGVLDVSDCADGVKYLAEEGVIDAKRVAIRGGSAGGFTVLSALATSDAFSAGTSLYGISDLRLLTEQTHKFESQYDLQLLGAKNAEDPILQERSPINHTERISAPLLLLQGEEDAVVGPDQARLMEAKLRDQDVPVELAIYPGEGHGFTKAATIADAMERELAFYRRTWSLSCATN